MPVALDLVVPNPALMRTAYTHIKVYRAPSVDATYVEATGPTTRIAITGEIAYTFNDPTGAESDYYKIAYWNQRTGAESDQGNAVQGTVDPALEVISVAELRTNYLFGVDLSNDDGTPYPESLFQWYIKSAVSWLETELDMPIRPQTITAERHDFHAESYGKFQLIRTHKYPIVEVTEVRATFPSSPESSRTYPSGWIQADLETGYVEIVPGAGALAFPYFAAGGILMPSVAGTTLRYIPHTYEIDYVAGFARGAIPAVLKDVAGKLAAMGPLNIAGDLIAGAGVANFSISMDGLSQSVGTTSSATNAGYGSRIIQYQKDIKAQIPTLRRYYQGIRMAAV